MDLEVFRDAQAEAREAFTAFFERYFWGAPAVPVPVPKFDPQLTWLPPNIVIHPTAEEVREHLKRGCERKTPGCMGETFVCAACERTLPREKYDGCVVVNGQLVQVCEECGQ